MCGRIASTGNYFLCVHLDGTRIRIALISIRRRKMRDAQGIISPQFTLELNVMKFSIIRGRSVCETRIDY